jgi:hypothetical protein
MAKKKLTSETLTEKYIDALLLHPEELTSIYKFCKFINIEEVEFYSFYSSFEGLENNIFISLFEATLATLHDSKEYKDFDDRNKLLLFYYTFFENLKLNRSAVKAIIGDNLMRPNNQQKLSSLKNSFESYINTFALGFNLLDNDNLKQIESAGIKFASWSHFMLLMKYWLEDNSNNFENTDVLIEKSVNTGLDVLESNILTQMFDLGKFLLKDKINL